MRSIIDILLDDNDASIALSLCIAGDVARSTDATAKNPPVNSQPRPPAYRRGEANRSPKEPPPPAGLPCLLAAAAHARAEASRGRATAAGT